MNRHYLISIVRDYRDQLHGNGFKRSADNAEDLVEAILDAGTEWQRLVPRVHTFVDHAERTLRRIGEGLLNDD